MATSGQNFQQVLQLMHFSTSRTGLMVRQFPVKKTSLDLFMEMGA